MKLLLTACLVATTVATSALAEVAQDVPPAGTAAPGNPQPETKAERHRNSAAKLAGLLYFVQNACPDLQPDYDRFKEVVRGLGVTLEDLSAGDLLLRSRTYTEVYTKDTPASCTRANANFGSAGTTIPGLIVKRAAQ